MSTPAAVRAALDDLKELLREGVITLPQWRDEVAALVRLERDMRRQPPPPPPLPPPLPPKPPRQAPPPPPRPTRAAVAAAAARARALTDADVDEVLADAGWGPEPAQAREPAGFYHAEFTVQVYENKDLGGLRRAGSYTLRGWAQLTAELATATKAIQDASPVVMGIDTWPVAAAFGWGEIHNNWNSTHCELTVDTFEAADDGHEPGTWDATGVKLTRRGRVQPTLGCPAGRFVKAGCDIARAEFYREDSCMLSLFLETFAGRLKTYRDDLTLEGLYRMATGGKLIDGQPAGVSLREAEKWLARWRLAGRAINARGEFI